MPNDMESLARKVLIRMFAPTVVVGIWTYAHLESVKVRPWVSIWNERGTVRIGDPYTAPLPVPTPWTGPASAYDEQDDRDIEGIAAIDGTF